MSAPDYCVPDGPSPRALNFRQYDETLEYRVVQNDSSRQALAWLLMARNIFHRELAQMPENYISRLVFNEHHRTVILMRDGVVLGGITFRPFAELHFAEIAFCAVSTQQQIRGYGAHIMARVKTYLQAIGVHHILTYADNTAIGYFKRQGFTMEINLDPAKWRRCIKDYQGATLIHCKVRGDVDYLRINDVVLEQKRLLSSQLPDLEVSVITEFPVTSIRGIKIDRGPEIDFEGQLLWIVDRLKLHSRSWPFLNPVSKVDAPNYFDTIKQPMDLSILEKNVHAGRYPVFELFVQDVKLIFSNCYQYNGDDSVYSRSAKELEDFFDKLMDEYKVSRGR
jgi:histone acetyltransferase